MIRLARRLLLLAALLVPGVAIPAPEVVVSDAGDRIARASTDKSFHIVEGANHMDLYDGQKFVDEAVSVLAPFFQTKLSAAATAQAAE